MAENIRVVIRFRPINSRERIEQQQSNIKDKPLKIIEGKKSDHITICSSTSNDPNQFSFDKILNVCSQQEAFEAVGLKICIDALNGYNGTIFAYGQTGSGKTYSMLGDESDPSHVEKMGIIPRCISFVFAEIQDNPNIKEATVQVSFCEIYKEKLRDLLTPSQKNLKVKLQKNGDTRISNLTEKAVTCLLDVLKLLEIASANRTRAQTNMNATSSRSHMLMTLTMTMKMNDDSVRIGRVNFADLAGSEKVRKTGVRGERLKEAQKINLSLTMLGQTISFLAKGKSYIPYRDSLLTYILKDSLGGNCKTCLLLCASPHMFNREETINSLRFGSRCKMIKNKAEVNKVLSNEELMALVKKLKQENKRLKDTKKGGGFFGKKKNKKNKKLEMEYDTKINELQEENVALETERDNAKVQLENVQKDLIQKNTEYQQECTRSAKLKKIIDENKAEIDTFKTEHAKFTNLIRELENQVGSDKRQEIKNKLNSIENEHNKAVNKVRSNTQVEDYKKMFNQMKKKNMEMEIKLNIKQSKIYEILEENEELKKKLTQTTKMLQNNSFEASVDRKNGDSDSGDDDIDLVKRMPAMGALKFKSSDVSENEILQKPLGFGSYDNTLARQQSKAIDNEHKNAINKYLNKTNTEARMLSLFSGEDELKKRQAYLLKMSKQSRIRLSVVGPPGTSLVAPATRIRAGTEIVQSKPRGYSNANTNNDNDDNPKPKIQVGPLKIESVSTIKTIESRADVSNYIDDDDDDETPKKGKKIVNNINNRKPKTWWECFSCLGDSKDTFHVLQDSDEDESLLNH